MDFFAGTALPGITAASVTTERWALWAGATWYLLKQGVVVSTATDAGNSPTTELRHGLLMGQATATPYKFSNYSPNVVTGLEKVAGFLWEPRSVIDSDGTAIDRICQICVMGPVKNGQLLLLDQQARAQMFNRFIFDDDLCGNSCGWQRVVAKTASYTVLTTDNNTIFTNQGQSSGTCTFTLPAVAKGLRFRFVGEADQTWAVAAASAILVAFNNAACTSITFSTSSEKIGSAVEVFANADGTKWLSFVMLGSETATPSIA